MPITRRRNFSEMEVLHDEILKLGLEKIRFNCLIRLTTNEECELAEACLVAEGFVAAHRVETNVVMGYRVVKEDLETNAMLHTLHLNVESATCELTEDENNCLIIRYSLVKLRHSIYNRGWVVIDKAMPWTLRKLSAEDLAEFAVNEVVETSLRPEIQISGPSLRLTLHIIETKICTIIGAREATKDKRHVLALPLDGSQRHGIEKSGSASEILKKTPFDLWLEGQRRLPLHPSPIPDPQSHEVLSWRIACTTGLCMPKVWATTYVVTGSSSKCPRQMCVYSITSRVPRQARVFEGFVAQDILSALGPSLQKGWELRANFMPHFRGFHSARDARAFDESLGERIVDWRDPSLECQVAEQLRAVTYADLDHSNNSCSRTSSSSSTGFERQNLSCLERGNPLHFKTATSLNVSNMSSTKSRKKRKCLAPVRVSQAKSKPSNDQGRIYREASSMRTAAKKRKSKKTK